MRRYALLVVGIFLAFSVAIPLAAQPDPDTIVLTVNDTPIHFWEVAIIIPQVQMEMANQGMQPEREAVIRAAMKRVVDVRLLAQVAREKGLQADSVRVGAALADLEERSGGRDGLDTALAEVGMSYDKLRSSISETDLVQVYIASQIDPQVTVTAEEVETFYQQNPERFARPDMVRARHILIRITQQADQAEKDSAKARATAAHKRVVAGEDFAKVATEVSEEPNAANGGDLGFFARDSMVPAMTDAAFALDIGEISGVIETQFGYHILKVEEKRAASTMSFEEAKEPLEQMLRENKAGEKVSKLLAELNEAATVVQVPPPGAEPAGPSGG